MKTSVGDPALGGEDLSGWGGGGGGMNEIITE